MGILSAFGPPTPGEKTPNAQVVTKYAPGNKLSS